MVIFGMIWIRVATNWAPVQDLVMLTSAIFLVATYFSVAIQYALRMTRSSVPVYMT